MRLRSLYEDRFKVVGVMLNSECPAEQFLAAGEKSEEAARIGMTEMLKIVASNGLDNIPHAWVHEANKQEKIYEFIKGPLRLFFFKGVDGHIAVCTTGARKSGKKADKGSVSKAAEIRKQYFEAHRNGTLTVVT